LIYLSDDGYQVWIVLNFPTDFGAYKLDNAINILVANHHFLMMTLDLMSIPGLDKL